LAVDYSAGLYQVKLLSSVWLVEGITAVWAVVLPIIAYRLYKSRKATGEYDENIQ
jgi:hypothetical protein